MCTTTWKQTDPQTDRYSKGAVTEVYTTVWESEVNRATVSGTRHRAQRTTSETTSKVDLGVVEEGCRVISGKKTGTTLHGECVGGAMR